jgi:hypothetical protein
LLQLLPSDLSHKFVSGQRVKLGFTEFLPFKTLLTAIFMLFKRHAQTDENIGFFAQNTPPTV